MFRHRSLTIGAIAIVAIAAGMLLARALLNSANPRVDLARATLLSPPRPVADFTLTDQSGAVFNLSRLKNQWSLLFFGFTHCPDVCPTTLSMLAQVEKALADLPAAARPHVVLVSVDPQRDTPTQLAAYVKFFSPSFAGVTGTQSAMDEFTRQLGVPVAISKLDNGDYTVDHSAAIFLIDPNAALRALFSTPHSPSVIAADYRTIVTAR